MNPTLEQLADNARRVREKYERLGLVTMPKPKPQPIKAIVEPATPRDEEERRLARLAYYTERRAISIKMKNDRVTPSILDGLRVNGCMSLAQLAKRAKASPNRIVSAVQAMAKQGVVHTQRVADGVWVARVGDTIPVRAIEAEALRVERSRSLRRRRTNAEARARTTEMIRALNGKQSNQ